MLRYIGKRAGLVEAVQKSTHKMRLLLMWWAQTGVCKYDPEASGMELVVFSVITLLKLA